MQNTNTKDLLAILVQNGALPQSREEFVRNESLKTGKSYEEVMTQGQLVDPKNIAKARATLLGFDFVELLGKKIADDVLKIIPRTVAENYGLVPFDLKDGEVSVAMKNPSNIQALESLDFALRGQGNLRYKIFVVDGEGLSWGLRQYENLKEEVGEVLRDADKELERAEDVDFSGKGDIAKVVEKAPVSKAIDIILKHSIEAGASDIHVDPMSDSVRIRYRVDGELKTAISLSKEIHNALVARIKILSNLKIDENRIPQDGRFHSTINNKEVDFRVSILPTVNGEKVVMRVLDSSEGVHTLKDLGILGSRLNIVQDYIKKDHGMLLVTGPTGSGKSTTLYSVLGMINNSKVNIVTLEDPVEYFIPGISQSQINPKMGFSFASGLRYVLRQDPDVIMIGEIRDKETAEMAIHASLTGHVVLSTLHTNSASGAVPRLLDMGIEKYLLMSALDVIVAQRLVRKLCNYCKKKVKITPEEKMIIDKEWNQITDEEKKLLGLGDMKIVEEVYHANGCEKCGGEGYRGRIGIFEIISMTEDVQNVVAESPSSIRIKEAARKDGFMTMMEDGVSKVAMGLTTVEEVLRATQE